MKSLLTQPSITLDQAQTSLLHQQLFAWWRKNGRILPWRQKLGSQIPSTQIGEAMAAAAEVFTLEDQTTSLQFNQQPQRSKKPSKASTSSKFTQATIRDQHFQEYFASSLQRDPYRVVISEMMLQQTQVERVLSKYHDWLKKWPSEHELARTQMSEVLILWQGLGYNRRAKFLWQLAKTISQEFQGIWPTTEESLLKLPGIGRYTARAIMSFAFGQQVGVVDTNVKRVLQRMILGLESLPPSEEASSQQSLLLTKSRKLKNPWFSSSGQRPKYPVTENTFFELADAVLPSGQADPWNQALMDFGALICTSRNPNCSECPVSHLCQANLEAQALGFATFVEWQKRQLSFKKPNAKPKQRFEETNRFFRGRMMDELRTVNSLPLSQFLQKIEAQYGLDHKKAAVLLEQLAKEELITLTPESVSLGVAES